jgi:CHAT domain-containing protein/Tfp pilus assembly protein PilF
VALMINAQSTLLRTRGMLTYTAKLFISLIIFGHLSFSDSFSQSEKTPEDLFKVAESLFIFNESAKADSLFRSIEGKLCEEENTFRLCIEAKLYRANIKRHDREFELSKAMLKETESYANELLEEGNPAFLKIYIQRTYLYEDLTELEEAKYWANKSLEFVEEYNISGKDAARAYIIEAFMGSVFGDYRESVEAYKKAFVELEDEERTINTLRLLSQAHNNIGVDYRRLGMSAEARHHYLEAREIVKEVFGENHHEMALIYNSLGTVYYDIGDYGTAAEHFIRSATIFKNNFGEVNNRVAIAYNNAGICYFQLNDLDSAAEYFEIAQDVKKQIHGGDHIDLAVGYNTLGSLYMEMRDYDLAEENYLLSIQVRKNIYGGDHPNLVIPLLSISGLYIQMGEEVLARNHLQESIRIGLSRLGQSHPNVLEAYLLIALSYINEKDIDSADHYYDKVMSRLIEDYKSDDFSVDITNLNHPIKLIETIRGKNNVLRSRFSTTGEKEYLLESLTLSEIASETIDLLQRSYQSEASKLNLLDTNYEIYSNALDALYELYTVTDEKSWLEEIFYYSEKSRSRIALELLQNVEARNFGGVPEEILAEERDLNTRVTNLLQRVNLEEEKGADADREMINNLTDSLFYAHRELSAFTQRLETNYPSYYQLKYDQRLASSKDIQEFLNIDETLISYSFGEADLYAIIIDNENIEIKNLGNTDGLSEKINELRSAVTGARTEQYRKTAYELHQFLIQPIRHLIQTESVIFIPDQYLNYLPFEMLLSSDAENRRYHQFPYLIRDFRIQYVPSGTMMMLMNNQRPSEPRNLLALAPFHEVSVTYDKETGIDRHLEQLSPLPLTLFETREIAKLFRERKSIIDFFLPERTEVLTDRRASKNRIINGDISDYGYIHFATHAFVNESNPGLSGIALHGGEAEDGIIYVSDIYNLQMNADLVVLGACDTGLGSIRKGEGLIGFTRAFIYAGASNLVVSMWKVNDQPTAHLMIGFYSNIRRGQSYGEALRNAKLELIDHPEYAAPRNWAAFVLNGR